MTRRPISRRAFLVSAGAGAAGLVLGVSMQASRRRGAAGDSTDFAPNLWVRIAPDGLVHLTIHKSEMGQGVLTALPMIIAEELGASWDSVRVYQADGDFRYPNQNTSGSSSVSEAWLPLRTAGAAARAMLAAAAAARWGVAPTECDTEQGHVVHARTGRRIPFGELVAEAARVPLPDPRALRLRRPGDFRLVGRPTPRLDAPAKVTGRHVYGLDVRLPGMLYAAVARCPVIGGKVAQVDDATARAVPGVRQVVRLAADAPSRLPERVAVVAETTWAALQGRRALRIEWDEGPNAALSSETVRETLRLAERRTPAVARNDGDALRAGVLGSDAVSARYALPYLAHAPMEPMNCTAHVRADGMEIWAPTQHPHRAIEHVSRATGLPRDAIRLHVISMGGGFGRRVYPDFVVEAAQIAREVTSPVKTVWTREDDIRNDFFRPATAHYLAAALDPAGRPRAWLHRMAGPSLVRHALPGQNRPAEDGEVGGAVDMPYDIPSVRVEYYLADLPVPLGVWRSVSLSQNVFAVESFVDELAHRARHDPVAYRLALLGRQPRLARVLRRAAELAGWGGELPAATGRGVAVNSYGPTFVAQVAEVAVGADARPRVARIVCVVDCGRVVNPLGVEAQVQGGIVWGLSAALFGNITLRNGRVEQSNFHDYRVARMADVPRLDVELVDSGEEPSGIGEPPVAGVAPALANAIFAATGVRHRELPLHGDRPRGTSR